MVQLPLRLPPRRRPTGKSGSTAPLLPLLLPPPVLPLPLLPLLAVVVPLPLLAVVVPPPLPLPEAWSAQTGGASVTGGPAGQPWGW